MIVREAEAWHIAPPTHTHNDGQPCESHESRLGYRLTEEYREHGDLTGIGMEHPNGGPGLAFRLDPERARRAAGFDYFTIGLPDKDSNTFEAKAGVPLQRF